MTTASKQPRAQRPKALVAPPRLRGLDGLRALAVLAVIAYHFLPRWAVGGYVGVDVFFVISGFLITGLLVRERAIAGRISLPRFWARRARRLFPAIVLLVAACGAAALFIGGDVLVGLGSQVVGAATFSSNWLFIAEGASYFDSATPELFRNLWSLAVEEQFYLIWPGLMLLLLLVPSRVVRIVLVLELAVASAIGMWLLASADPTRVYYGTDTHAFGLALGAAVALLLEGRFLGTAKPRRATRVILPILGVVGVLGILAASAFLQSHDSLATGGGLAAVAVLSAVAIVGATTEGSWLGRALDVLPLRWIGERSYGLYLWHWPVLVLFVVALPLDSPWWVAPGAALIVTVGAAWASYRFVETPVRVRGLFGAAASLATGRTALRAAAMAGAVALLVATGLTGAAISRDPGKGEAELAITQGQQAIADATAPALGHSPERSPMPPGGEQIYALGDSVMLAAAPELQQAFPGIAIDATVSRSMWVAPDLVQSIADSGALRPILIVGLGTNGEVDPVDLEAMLDAAGPDTLVIVVNAQAPKPWIPGVNTTLATFAAQERTVELANWHDAIAPRINELASDEVHPGGPISGGIYVGAIENALQRLADLPPLRSGNDYGQLNRPT